MGPHVCPDCRCYFNPRGQEGERCWSCMGLSVHQHVAELRRQPAPAVSDDEDQPTPTLRLASGETSDWRHQFVDLLA